MCVFSILRNLTDRSLYVTRGQCHENSIRSICKKLLAQINWNRSHNYSVYWIRCTKDSRTVGDPREKKRSSNIMWFHAVFCNFVFTIPSTLEWTSPEWLPQPKSEWNKKSHKLLLRKICQFICLHKYIKSVHQMAKNESLFISAMGLELSWYWWVDNNSRSCVWIVRTKRV